jgi:polar amino acid transport system substrate-binding protein
MLCFPHQDNTFISVNLAAGPMPKVGGQKDFKGVDVDIMAGFARSLGVSLEIRPIGIPSYGELIPALLRGDGDVVASSFSMTVDRQKVVDFSDIYYNAYRVVVVRQDSTIASPADLSGKVGALLPGSSQIEDLKQLGVKVDNLHPADFPRDGYLSVREKEADYTVLDTPGATKLLREFPTLKAAFKLGGAQPFGFAFQRGSDLRAAVNRYLEKISGSGELTAIFVRHGVVER